MPSKLQTYMQMADEAQRQITGSYRGWTGFLTTAARLYKYPYAEQVMIHAQRPDATACAEYDFWNEKMGRYVRRGSKGIALIDSSGERPRLRYVFDVSDTGGREFPKSRYLWEYREEHAGAVSAMLESRYGVDGKGGLPDQLERIASQLAEEYWRDYKRDILAIVDDSFLYGYDEFNVGAAFQSAAAVSIAYSLMSRCGLEADDRFEHEDFLSIFDFNTPEAAAELGTAVSRINGEVLRQIEVTIKNYEREKFAERSHSHDRADLHQERGLPDSRPDAERNAGGRETPGQVRETAQELPSGAQTGAVQPSGAVGEAVPASAGDRRDGESEIGADDAGADEVGGRDGGAESPRPDEMGEPHEQPESAGRGDHPQRAGVQLTNDVPEAEPAQPPIPQAYQLSLFPTEDEQIAYIAEAESYTPSAFSMSIPQSDIDHILRMEGNADYARMKIATEFSKGKSVEEIAAFLQSSFHGGNGVVTESGRYSAWYADDGIHIANGDAARYLTSAKVVSWQDAAERIGQLLEQGEYAANVELAEAPGHERTELAQSIWYLRQDLSEKARAQGYLSCLSDMRGGGFPEETARLAGRLTEPAFREVLLEDFMQFQTDYREDRGLLRFHFHKPDNIEQGLRELSLPRREYRTEMAEIPAVQRFITEDEIAATLTRGSNIAGGKGRIYAYFKEKHSPKEQADFLKDEYGIGGRSHAVSGASHSGEDHSGKGVSLKKQDCPEIQLNWANVAKRISELIRKDRFLTPEEKTQYEQLQRQTAARSAAWNDYNAVKEAHPDDLVLFQVGDFFELYGEDAKQAAGLLDMNLTSRSIPGAGRVEMCGVPLHNLEMYVEKLRDKYDVTIAEAPDFRGERRVYTLRSVDHEAEAAINAYEAEFGADGTRVFRDPAAEQVQPTVQELFERYRLSVGNALSKDEAFLNACRNSDRQNAYLEGAAAIRRIVTESGDLQLTRLYFDMPAFHNRLHQELLDELYPTLATTVTPSPYKVTQADIDAALQQWNGRIESKHAVVRYMKAHARDRDTAAWLAREYGLYDVEIRTLRFDEPEHDPPSAEPAEPEPPAMSEEEALLLEQEGRAALSEMGEFVPDPDDVTLQAEIDETPTHRHAVSISIDGEWQGFPSADAAEQAAYADFKAASHRNAQNFHITDDALGVGGAKAKFRANMAAIHLLQELEFEGLQASPEQQEILSRYVGWGGLADAFDPDKAGWRVEYDELKGVLSPEEYAAARASTLNAHYTSPTVIRTIYDAVENMGFQTGNILEPSMGVGNFFGMLPESMKSSRLYGVELDSITGRIAKQLYPKADITVAGFETTDRKDFFDLAVGNVPFGQYQVSDRAFDKLGFSIHNYFFAKALEQVRPGGVVAFVTSRYTMDAKDSAARKYIAQRADFLGALRLPNNAFKANAGTDVVSDIIFLQKRDRPIEIEPDWVHTGIWRNQGANADGFAINQYFIDHPEMVLGRQTSESTQYGRQDFTVAPAEGADLAEQLSGAIRNIRGTYAEAELPDLGEDETIVETIPADPNVRNFSYTVVDGELYYRQNSIMTKPDFNATAKERAKGMVELRDCVQKLISQQMDGFISDDTIRQTQAELNTLYDGFTAKYGLINSRANALAFAEDSSYYLLCSLEELDEDKNLKRKADMFTRRTIRAHEAVTSVDTASEALALSISEKACVDMEYMSKLTGRSQDELINELNGVIFLDPVRGEWQTADEYLSGNVRQKLREAEQAAQDSPGYLPNVEALRQAQPRDLDASEIEVRLGATWIDPSYIREFMWETFETPFYQQRMIDVTYSAFTAEWNIMNKNAVSYSNIAAYMTYGTERANAYKILEDTLNLRDVRIYDTKHDADGRERRVLNSKETTLAQQKQQAIKDAFRDWIWRDPDRRHTLVARYNELFNSTRPREYDGSHITFAGMNPEIRLREHQLNAVAHVLYGGNTLLAHEVGAGKTFEMVAAAMESKRLGLCHKSLFVVPNHLTEQWSGEFLRLYPSANILVATKKDFEPKNRKKFCARIATGEYDAVIIGHSQFEKIPVSMERQQRLLAEQIFEVEEGLRELKSQRAERFTIKSLERTKRGLEAKLKKLQDSSRKDDVVTFEQLGVDRLYVDEAHNYKNLFLYTKMRNVAGLSATDAQKSSDMLLKCRYIDEITDSRGVVFATGTPVSNSMTELYTMMRYLQHNAIRGKGLAHFDCWASTFGETQTAIELAPEGTGYRARTRFAKFFNLPELMTLFKEAADIKTSDQLNLPTPTPIYHNEVAQPTEIQKQMVQELSERAARVHAQLVDPGTDNMLKITSDGRKLGLDQRIINPDLPDDPNSKVNRCVDNILRIWQDGQADRLTQLVFCDLSTPKTGATGAKAAKTAGGNLDSPELNAVERLIDKENPDEPGFTVYDDIREKLVARGIPREQIAFIHEANTETRKKELFAKVRSGQVRVLMGSTFKMGAGMNVQDRLVALHDLDCPWRPGDLEQRSGRIIRQGNRNKEVHIYRYVTESTFDAYLWQTVENKQKFISQIMTSKSPVRSCEDVDETALSYAEIKALCAGDERIKEKMDLDVDVARLKLMKASHRSQQFRLEDNLLRHFPEQIRQNESFVEGFTADMQTLAGHPHPVDGFAGMEVKGDLLTDKDNAGAAILEAFKDAKGMEPVPIGSYRGFAMSLTVEDFGRDFILTLKGKMNHRVTLGKDARGNLTRIDNALNAMPDRLQNVRNTLDALTAQMETAKAELGKPFPQEDELRTKSARLAELNAELNIDDRTPMEQMAEDAPAVQSAKAERPSVLAKLKAPLSQPCAEDKNKHRNKAER